jgi:DNA-directed RNA polymerase subunit RPC12/RpoP
MCALRYDVRGGERLVKCGLCGGEVEEQPKITAEGKCSVCGAKLAIKK